MDFAQCVHDITMSHGLVISMFLAGLVGGVTHCVGMCSPFVLAQLDNNGIVDKTKIKRLRSSLLLPYHMGRLTTYIIMALLLSSIINLAFIYSDLRALVAAPMLVLAAIIFLVSAFPKLATLFPWAANIKVSFFYKFISNIYYKFNDNNSVVSRYFLGVLLGFIPCGLVVSALLASASAPDILQTGLSMAAFAIGTMPALFIVALGGQTVKNKYPKTMIYISKTAMVLSSLWLFILAGQMINKMVL